MWSKTLLFSLLSLSLVEAAPASSPELEPKSFTFPLYKRSTASGTSKLNSITTSKEISTAMVLVSELLSTKNSKGISLSVNTDGVGKAATAIVEQHGNDISYYLDLEIGSNGQNFSVIIDTGSYYSWVYGTNCTSSVCTSHNQYNMSASKSGKLTGEPFSIQYTTSSVSGNIFTDVISFAGFETILDFGAANQAGNTFASFPIDGIMGLPANEFSPESFPSILTTLKNQSLINERVFSVNLGMASSPDDEGSITFGGIDPSKYEGDVYYTNVESGEILWTIPIDSASVNGDSIDFGANRSAVVDTGTTLLVMPPDDALKLHGRIPGSETDGTNFAIPCNSEVTVNLEFNGVQWPITKENFIGSPLKSDASMCATNVQGLNIQDSNWILGDTFLKTVYTVFDMDGQRVGFANKTIGSTDDTPKDSLVLASLSTVSSDSLSSSATSTTTSTSTSTSTSSKSTVLSTSGTSSSTLFNSSTTVSTTSSSHSSSASETNSAVVSLASASSNISTTTHSISMATHSVPPTPSATDSASTNSASVSNTHSLWLAAAILIWMAVI